MGGGIWQIAPVRKFGFRIILAALVSSLHFTRAADWPQWRYNSGRGAVTPHALPKQLHLQWSRQLKEAWPAWPATQSKLGFDLAPEPVVAAGRLFVPNSTTASVSAYDAATGKELWRFYTEGAVRFAPVASKDKIWFVSDDGHLYCLKATDGKLLWKFNGGPSERWGLGHGRMVSTWPARGGPVYRDGKIWFTASIWPFMGIFVHCLEAETGRVLWTNSGEGMNYTVQPHGAPSFATVAPQGHLTLAGNQLIVPGGRSTPAVFQADTGKLSHFKYDKKRGHYRVYAGANYYFVDGGRYQVADGKSLGESKTRIIGSDYTISQQGDKLAAQRLVGQLQTRTVKDRKGKQVKETKFVVDALWNTEINKSAGELFLQAGARLYSGAEDEVSSFELTSLKAGKSAPEWSAKIKGKPWTMLAADDRLFVVTQESQIFCFGAKKMEPAHHTVPLSIPPSPKSKPNEQLQRVLNRMAGTEGYALLLGADSDSLDTLLNHTKLHLVVVESDSAKVAALRKRYDATGFYGERINLFHQQNPADFPVAPYFANLVLVQEPIAVALKPDALQKVYHSVRPYGGVLCLLHKNASLRKQISSLPQLQIQEESNDMLLATKEGALPGSADWTHQYADAGQSVVSRDKTVKAPLGLLWFGGPSNAKILPRHGHGPSPQVAGGRLIIEGGDILRAVDVYTGRLLWERELEGVGEYYNITGHFPGAGEIGSNYVSLPDAVYVVYGTKILELNVETGQTKKEFSLPNDPNFGWLSVQGDYLVTTIAPIAVKLGNIEKKQKAFDAADKVAKDAEAKANKIGTDKHNKKKEKAAALKTAAAKRKLADAAKKALAQAQPEAVDSRFASGSRQLAVFNRHTAKLLWTRDAQYNFRHNNIALDAGSVFVIDSLTEARLKAMRRRGLKPKGKPVLYALDINNGNLRWQTDENVFGTFLNYSTEHDLLLQAGSAYRDRAKDDIGQGMVAYRGRDGKILWANKDLSYNGPCLLMKDKIITNGNGGFAIDIKTGKPTGWKYKRNYGCNTAIGSEHLLTFRSGAAGFYDLTNDGGTGNWGGFRSSCTANLIPANGILNAPDYTRTCSCAYQMQTSLALIHMPELEYWTFGATAKPGQLAINLGAPGDRRAPDGKLWVEHPKVGGDSVDAPVTIEPADAAPFRLHSSAINGDDLKWVAASGLRGVKSVKLKLEKKGAYRVRLHFLEPDELPSRARLFDIVINDQTVQRQFDIAATAGSPLQSVVREFIIAAPDGTIQIALRPATDHPPILSGIEWSPIP